MLCRRIALAVLVALVAAPGAAHAAFPGANGKIATTWYDSFNDGIHAVNPDGSGDTWLTPDDSTSSQPAWSPDGTKIAFASYSGNWDVWVIDWELAQAKVYDGGADGDASTTGDNQLFQVQGVFVP